MVSSLPVQRKLINMIKRFQFEELKDAVMPIFPEISWNHVRSKLIKSHKNFTITNAVRAIEEAINDSNIRNKDLQDRLALLEVIDVSRHNKKKTWYGYELTDLDKPVNYFSKREIEESTKKEFHLIGLNINVKIVAHDDITFVCIKEKKKKRKIQHVIPIFFALFLGQRYFFCSKKDISHNFVKVMASALGYKNSKKIKLMGKDLKSLMKLLWIKQQGVLHAEDLNRSLMYKASDPIIKNMNVDYTQAKQRKDYTNQCFGKNPPTLELLVINGPHESIQHHNLTSILPTDNIRMNWEFRSHNIAKFLTNLAEKRVFTPPLPYYVSNLMMIGKNELTLQAS